jgi:purine-binding chemotaxis protein CheW
MSQAVQATASLSTGQPISALAQQKEFLTFVLGEERYGIDIQQVREIRRYEKVTALANLPAYIKGVIDLRGTIVPVIDLRIKLKLERADYNGLTVLIILNVGERTLGIVVDAVSDVIAYDSKEVKAVPEMGGIIDCRYITGLIGLESGMLILLDMGRFLSGEELDLLPGTEAELS